MDDFNEQVFEMIGRLRQNGLNNSRSKAAAVIKAPCDMIVSNNPNRDKSSKAASSTVFSSDEELFPSAPPGPVPDRIRQRIVQTAEGPAKVTSYEYERLGSSTGDQVYQCGTHNFETRNVKEFNNHINRTHNDSTTTSSKAASVTSVNKAKEICDFINSNPYSY
jgi:hypothetical protein